MRFTLPLVAALMLSGAGVCAFGQTAPARIIRGVVVSVEGDNVAIRTRAGESVHLHLKDQQSIIAVVPATLADVKPGVFVGVAAMPAAGGALTAMEVHIFPEAQRGTGEGFRPFDLAPGSSMTNANISARIDTVSGPKLTLTYKGGEQTITVDKTTPIVTFAEGEAGDVKPGAEIDLFRPTPAAGGAVEAARVLIGRNGTRVPM